MRKILVYILVVSLFVIAGCNNIDNVQSSYQSNLISQNEINSSEIIPLEDEVVSIETSTSEINSQSQTSEITSTVEPSNTPNQKPSTTVSTVITSSEIVNSVVYNNPPYGTMTMIHPYDLDCEFNTWGWAAVSITHIWFEDVDGGSWGTKETWGEPTEEQLKIWHSFADPLVSHLKPKNDGVAGEKHEYTIWVWVDKENAGTGIKWDVPEYGTVSLEDPFNKYEDGKYIGGIWGWKQQYLIWEWCVDEGEDEGYWSNVQQGFYYNPDVDDPNDEWEKYASKYVARPERDGEYVGERVYKTAWVWLEQP